MDKGFKVVNHLQKYKKKKEKPTEQYRYNKWSADYKARTKSDAIVPCACKIPWTQYHNSTKLKHPVGQKISTESLEIDAMISQMSWCLVLTFNRLLARDRT